MERDLRKINIEVYCRKLIAFLYLRKNRKYKRVLPLAEYFNDRVKKAEFLGCGVGSTCYDNVYVFGDVKIGKNVFIGPFCILDGSGGLKIGDNCSIAAGVQIYTHDSVKWAVSMGKSAYEYGSVEIGSGCYIGPNVVISKGVKIGKGSIVGACSFVNRNIPAYSKVHGIPVNIKSPDGFQARGGGYNLEICEVNHAVA